MSEIARTRRRRFTGEVVSVAGAKSVMVAVRKRVQHRLYRKYITRICRYMAHDESAKLTVGDQVTIEECRPMSARKRWRVVQS